MSNFSYQIQTHNPTNTAIFKEDANNFWLAVGIGELTKEPELLNRLGQWLATNNLSQVGFEALLNDYFDWYRSQYKTKKKQDYPFSDDQIVNSIGLLWLDAQGKATVFSGGNCQFSRWKTATKTTEDIAQGWQTIQLMPNDVLIADPKRADVAKLIYKALKENPDQAVLLDGPQSVAIVRAVAEATVVIAPVVAKRSYTTMLVLALVLSVLAGTGYVFKDNIGQWVQHATAQPDSVQVAIDTTLVLTDTTQTITQQTITPPVQTPDSSLTNQPTKQDTITNPPKPQPNEVTTTRPPEQDDKAQEWLSKANETFNLAKAKEADGYNSKALKLYKEAQNDYNSYMNLRPTEKHSIRKQLQLIDRKIQMLMNGEVSF